MPAPSQAILAVENLFRVFMDHSPLIVCIKDRDSVVRYGNDAWARRMGRPIGELIGRSEFELYPPDQAERFRASDQRVFRNGETVELTEQATLNELRPSWWQVIKFPLEGENGERLLGLFAWDVTDRVRIESALAASEAHVKAVLDTAVDAIVTIDTQGRVRSFNLAAARMFDYAPDEVLGHNVSMLMPEPDHSRHDRYIGDYLRTGEPRIIGIGREVTGRRKDGTMFPIDLSVSEVMGGGEHSFTGVMRDLTEVHRLDRELRERQAEAHYQREQIMHLTRVNVLGEMAAGIAHEINQPLSAVSTYATACQRLLQQPSPDVDTLLDTLGKVAEQARRAGEIIRRVRTLATPGVTEASEHDINTIVNECADLSDYEAHMKEIRINRELDDELPAVRIDRVQIQQVVINLLRNSIDALQEITHGREITLRTELCDGQVRVSVSDDGPGMSESTRERLFHHFHTTKQGGMGIGLAISNTIVEAHGGRLWFDADVPLTTFRFALPPVTETGDGA